MTGRVSSRHPASSILGVTLTPCAEGPCETGCLALLPDISFFWKRCGPCPPVLESTYLSKAPRHRRGTANAAVGGAGASIAQMYICTACRGYPGPQCRLLAEKLAAIRRRKEKNVDENKKEHHLHIVLTTQQYQLLCCQAKECRLTKRAYLARLIEGRPVKARPTKEIKELRTEIHHIGNNINQIARSVNVGIAKPEDAKRGLYLLDQVYELMFRIANK